MSTSDQMLYGDILEDDFGVEKTSPRTPLEDETFGDLFDDVLKGGGGGGGGAKNDAANNVREDITEADIALLDAPDEKPTVVDTPVEPEQEVGVTTTKSAPITWGLPTRPSTIYQEPMKKNSLFIGGLTWWTTDQDILAALRRAGYGTVRAIKMYENRGNGQFKGYAQVELDSDAEAIEAVEKIQAIEILGQKPVALYSMKTSPHQFELKCKGEGSGDLPSAAPPPHQPRSAPRPPPQSMPNSVSMPAPAMLPAVSGMRGPLLMDPANMGIAGMPGMGMPAGMPGMMPPNPMDPMGFLRPPLPMGGFPPMLPPGMGGFPRPPFGDQGMGGGMRPAAPHVNPAFFLKNQWEGMGGGGMGSPVHQPVGVPDDEELADVMHRNQQVSTTAIQRAEESAAQGDIDSAADTLKMAINIIKQSSVARMDSTQVLIKSLQDCMATIEDDYNSSHRSRSRHDDRDRERTSRHRDRSRERDGYRSSGSSSRHRERDRSRERRRF